MRIMGFSKWNKMCKENEIEQQYDLNICWWKLCKKGDGLKGSAVPP